MPYHFSTLPEWQVGEDINPSRDIDLILSKKLKGLIF